MGARYQTNAKPSTTRWTARTNDQHQHHQHHHHQHHHYHNHPPPTPATLSNTMADLSDHRRIALSTNADLLHLITQLESTAERLITANMPADDALRPAVQRLVNQYVLDIFNTAAPSIAINETAVVTPVERYREPVEEYEKFDAAAQNEVRRLVGEVERRVVENAEARRRVPALWAGKVQLGVEEVAREVEREVGEVKMKVEGEGEVVREVDLVEVEKEVRDTAERARMDLGKAKEGVPAVAAKLRRARDAADVVLKERRR